MALIVALGGTSYAVVQLPARSVGSKQLKPRAVKGPHIRANAITSSRVKDGSLTGQDLDMATLGQVPLAARAVAADRAAVADRATSVDQAARAAVAAGLDRVVYRVATVTIPVAPAPGESSAGVATARCDAGQLVVGGGVRLDEPENMSLVDSYPETAAAWTGHINNDDTAAAHTATVYAVCVAATTPG